MSRNAEWMSVEQCPGCGSLEFESAGVFHPNYYLDDQKITPDRGTIELRQCETCELRYKDYVPSFETLRSWLEPEQLDMEDAWGVEKGFEPHVDKLETLLGDRFDLLDVGSWSGEFLRESRRLGGKRSALDIVRHPSLDRHLNGEFIQGRLDGESIQSDEAPYDVITAFDVMEHLHDPRSAFQNVRRLLKDEGYFVFETGNPESFWPYLLGANNWPYVVNEVSHHVFWNRAALKSIAEDQRFRVLEVNKTRHRTDRHRPFVKRARHWVENVAFTLSPAVYRRVAKGLGKLARFPPMTGFKDHLFGVMRKRR